MRSLLLFALSIVAVFLFALPLNAQGQTSSEGLWYPELAFGGQTAGITYSTRVGSYTRIANRSFINGSITLSSKGANIFEAEIINLPLLSKITSSSHFVCSVYGANMAASVTSVPVGVVIAGSTKIGLYRFNAGNAVYLESSDFTDITTLIFSCDYEIESLGK